MSSPRLISAYAGGGEATPMERLQMMFPKIKVMDHLSGD